MLNMTVQYAIRKQPQIKKKRSSSARQSFCSNVKITTVWLICILASFQKRNCKVKFMDEFISIHYAVQMLNHVGISATEYIKLCDCEQSFMLMIVALLYILYNGTAVEFSFAWYIFNQSADFGYQQLLFKLQQKYHCRMMNFNDRFGSHIQSEFQEVGWTRDEREVQYNDPSQTHKQSCYSNLFGLDPSRSHTYTYELFYINFINVMFYYFIVNTQQQIKHNL
ncbi:Hypothetical_protein [Hexamita inflata]|uniref:Hypothetical_protein n=1 Tax=Hexamita inflata TaxID=28002 RepID=A0AA86UZW9_9EUKA|nr:Hypothetical protein HINF_LOCUS58561 [Hexamita inflata]